MPGEDYWLPIRRRWAELTQTVLHPRPGRDSEIAIKRWLNPFAGPQLGIAFTGMRGTGKTTLHKALRQRLPVGEYVQRVESPDREEDRFVLKTGNGRRRVKLVVVPGQKDSIEGKRTIKTFFKEENAPEGVVYSTSWGFSTIWDSASARAAVELMPAPPAGVPATDVEQIREYNLDDELADFKQTRDLLQDAWRHMMKPVWLIIAVSKVDLYQDEAKLREVGEYYIPAENPNNDTQFSTELRGLVDYIGQGRLRNRVAVVPVCAYLEQYKTVGGARVATTGDLDLTSVLMANVLTKIGEFCGGDPR